MAGNQVPGRGDARSDVRVTGPVAAVGQPWAAASCSDACTTTLPRTPGEHDAETSARRCRGRRWDPREPVAPRCEVPEPAASLMPVSSAHGVDTPAVSLVRCSFEIWGTNWGTANRRPEPAAPRSPPQLAAWTGKRGSRDQSRSRPTIGEHLDTREELRMCGVVLQVVDVEVRTAWEILE
jgi:hypothetical protein